MQNFRLPEHLVHPLLYHEQDDAVATAYTSFRDWARRRLRRGEPQEKILGSERVAADLFFRGRGPTDPHTASTWASEYFRTLPNIDIMICLAGIFNLSRFMQVSDISTCQLGPG